MAEDRLPPLDADTSLDLVLLVQFARTIADPGITGWWIFSHCPTHGDRQEPIFEAMPPPEAKMGCRRCYQAGITRVLTIEDIRQL